MSSNRAPPVFIRDVRSISGGGGTFDGSHGLRNAVRWGSRTPSYRRVGRGRRRRRGGSARRQRGRIDQQALLRAADSLLAIITCDKYVTYHNFVVTDTIWNELQRVETTLK